MEILACKTYLFLELLSFLNYKEIAYLREVSKILRKKIDNIDIWSKLIQQDHPNLLFICEKTALGSLAMLRHKTIFKRIVTKQIFNIGIFGSMDQFPKELHESETLYRAGFLGSLKEFVCNLGYCKFNIVTFPRVSYAKCQKKLFTTFLILANSENDSEDKVSQIIEETLNIGIGKFVVGLRADENHPFVNKLRETLKYVVAIDSCTQDNINKMMKTLYSAHVDKELINAENPLITQKGPEKPLIISKEPEKKFIVVKGPEKKEVNNNCFIF